MKNNCRVLVFRITPLLLSVESRLDSKFTGFWPDKLLLLSDLSETKMVLHFPGQSVMHICLLLCSKLVFFNKLWNGRCFARSGSQAEGGFPKAQIYLDKQPTRYIKSLDSRPNQSIGVWHWPVIFQSLLRFRAFRVINTTVLRMLAFTPHAG